MNDRETDFVGEGDEKKKREGSFECPACHSQTTKAGKRNVGSIVGRDLKPHYVRKRSCLDCGATWETVESVIMGSIKRGEAVLG